MTLSPSVSASALANQGLDAEVARLRVMAICALKRMYRPEQKLFAFRLRRSGDGEVLEGISRRYSATSLIGLAGESEEVANEVLAGQSAYDLCGHLLQTVHQATDLGEVALTLWAAQCVRHPDTPKALARLRSMESATGPYPTVELAWSLTALVADGAAILDEALARSVTRRLLASFRERSALFPHWPKGVRGSFTRSHVSCFADQVYPIQALSYYYQKTGDADVISMACRCADRICELQGHEGQWWWHYDIRTGQVVEHFPVYAVHQDAMGPMALRALEEAGGGCYAEAIERSVRWFSQAPELETSLIDHEAGVIWRKVGRNEPGKLTRSLQAVASRVHPHLRMPATNLLFRPNRIDYESRPYHMGWILYAWAEGKKYG